MKVSNKVLKSVIVWYRQLFQKIFNFNDDPIQFNADGLSFLWFGASLFSIQFLIHILAFFCKSNELIVKPKQNQGFWKLKKNEHFRSLLMSEL